MKNNLYNCYFLSPLVLVLISVPIDTISIEIGQWIKGLALLIVIGNSVIFNNKNVFFYLLLFVLFYIVFLGIYRQIKFFQSSEDGLRYLFPVIAIIYGFQLKSQRKTVLLIVLSYVLINDLYQLFNWILLPLFDQNYSYTLNRATGFVGFFDFFGFINIIALFIINHTKSINLSKSRRIIISVIFSIFLLWSLSLKMVVIFTLYVLFFNRKLLLLTVPALPFVFIYKDSLQAAFSLRINRYLLKPASARSESYRVLTEHYQDFLFFGQGPGNFGGPSSTKYNSLLYDKYNFNWYGEQAMATTDTFYPHLFVELGIIFGLIYLFCCVIIPLLIVKTLKVPFLILSTICINSVFSFAFNSLSYCFFSFSLIFVLSGVRWDINRDLITGKILDTFKSFKI